MKTVNFLTYYFIPENTAATNRVLAMVKELEKRYKVNVICATEKGKAQKDKSTMMQYSENINIYYINQKEYDGEKFYTRALYELGYAYLIAKKSNKIKSDVKITTAPSMFLIPVVALMVRGKKVIDIRDLVWDYMSSNSLFSKVLKQQIQALMKFSIKSYDYISVTNDHEIEWIKNKVKKDEIVKITNGIEDENFLELSSISLNKTDKFTITYVGNIGIAQNIETLIDAAKELKNVKINLVGEGSRYKFLKSYTKKNQISNVEFFGKVPRDKMIDFYNKSSILYAQLDEKFKAAMPSKLYEYASTGLPIIYGGVGEARKFVQNLDNCRAIDPCNVKQLIDAIKSFEDKDLKISEKNRDFIKDNFIRETQSEKLVDVVDSLVNK